MAKALCRGVLLKTKKDGIPEWFDIQYKKLLFYCLSCGIMGHSELECDKPVIRNDLGKLAYDTKLRAPEVKKNFRASRRQLRSLMGVVRRLVQTVSGFEVQVERHLIEGPRDRRRPGGGG